jgi:hypothetical protein
MENPELKQISDLLHADTPEQVIRLVIEAFALSKQLKLLLLTLQLAAANRESGASPHLSDKASEAANLVPFIKCHKCGDRGRVREGLDVFWCDCEFGRSLEEKQRYGRTHEMLEHLMDPYIDGAKQRRLRPQRHSDDELVKG